MRRLFLIALVVLAACNSGYTQEEVDALVAEAVEDAVAEAREDLVSEAEAQAQAEEAAKQASLVTAVDGCLGASTDPYITVDEAGLFMEGEGNEAAGTSYENIWCVLDALGIPESIVGRIESTNSTMGLVDGAWANYEAQWSYHPDNGLAVHVVVTD